MLPASRAPAPGGVRACCHTVCQQNTAATSGANAGCATSHTVTSAALCEGACMHALHTPSVELDTHTPLQSRRLQRQQQATANNRDPTQAVGRRCKTSSPESPGRLVPAPRTLLLCARYCPNVAASPPACLEVCVQLEVVQVALQASHDARLLVLAHTLLKEVGLAL